MDNTDMTNTSLIMKSLHGSQLYGLNTPESDVDYKGIFLNDDLKDILLGRHAKKISLSTGNDTSKNTNKDTDTELYELKTFIDDACSGQTICIDMIHTPDEFITELSPEYRWIWRHIRNNRSRFYSKNMNAFIGYAKKQAAKYGLKGSRMAALEEVYKVCCHCPVSYDTEKLNEHCSDLPISNYCKFITSVDPKQPNEEYYEVLGSKYQLTITWSEFCQQIFAKWATYGERARQAKDNNGVDWKALSHAFRAAYQLKEIFLTGDLLYPLKDRDILLKIKQGKLDFTTEVQPELEKLIKEVELLAESSLLPDIVDKEYWNDWLYNTYMDVYNLSVHN